MALSMVWRKVIETRGLRTRFGETIIHDNLDLDISRRRSGGRSAAAVPARPPWCEAVIMLLKRRQGSIKFRRRLSGSATVRRFGCGGVSACCFQQGALFGSLTVQGRMWRCRCEHTRRRPGGSRKSPIRKIARWRVYRPTPANKLPRELSGGMLKRAAGAGAGAGPALLFLDEPTSGLDPVSAARSTSWWCSRGIAGIDGGHGDPRPGFAGRHATDRVAFLG